jgi:cysteine sulfinate desulfinase/cysteine desulfurase-like protein
MECLCILPPATGVVQPLRALGELCRSRGVYFHTDGAQAVGKIPLNVNEAKVQKLVATTQCARH